jgi:putative oxidoreductase
MTMKLNERWLAVSERLEGVGDWLAPLGLRLLLAWEFWESGIEKFRGENWFASIQNNFPFPFNLAPPDLSWAMATWFELGGALALLLGLGTRFFAFTLLVLTMVATASVHWPMSWESFRDLAMGYVITDRGFGNFKLPLLFAAMLLPLVFRGAGKFSLDAMVARAFDTRVRHPYIDASAWSLGLLVLGIPLALLVPMAGVALIAVAIALAVAAIFLFA